MRDYKNKCNNIDDFNTECIWLLIVEKDDNDYDEILKHFDEYDEFFTNQIIAAIRMAKNGYIEKSKDTSHTYIFRYRSIDTFYQSISFSIFTSMLFTAKQPL